MRALNYVKAIRESAGRLLKLRDQQKAALYYRRLHFLYLLKSGSGENQGEAGAAIGIKQRGAQKLWNKYKCQGLKGLLTPSERMGRPCKLDEAAKQALQAQLHKDQIQTLQQATDFLSHSQGIVISQVAIHCYFKAMGIKKKTGRPFEEVRKQMSNTVYATIADVEQHLSQILQPYFHNNNKIIQLTNYPYLRTH